MHANLIVNRGHATSADVIELVRRVRARVEEAKGVKLERRIALIAGFSNILCELLRIDGRTTFPRASMWKQTTASPSIRSRRAMEGYFGNAVIAGTRSPGESVKLRVSASSPAKANSGSKSRAVKSCARPGFSALLVIPIRVALAVVNLDFRRHRVDRVEVHRAGDP